MEATYIGSKVTRNFVTYAEAEAFQDGVKVSLGILGADETQVTFGHILPLPESGYTTTLTVEREFFDNGGDF